jgi:hypothetical protein
MTLEEFKAADQLLKEMKALDREYDLWHNAYCRFLEKDEADIVTLYTNTCCNPPEIHMRVDEFLQMYFMVTQRIAAEQNRLGAEFGSIGKKPPVVEDEPPKEES